MIEHLYAAQDAGLGDNPLAAIFIEQAIDSPIRLCAFAAMRAALLDYHLGEYQRAWNKR